jgi:uncharacterized YigZ family protein
VRDCYQTIAGRSEYRQKIERSEFLGVAFAVDSQEEFFAELEKIRKHHFDATRHCWAFRLFENERSRSSDAGEPSGTAGKPILAAIEGAELFAVALVVVRWFGGVKLGTGGLSRAYRDTAIQTLRQATIIDRYLYDRVRVIVPFDRLADAYRLADPPAVVLVGQDFGELYEFSFDVQRSKRDEFVRGLAARRLTPR